MKWKIDFGGVRAKTEHALCDGLAKSHPKHLSFIKLFFSA